jgi:hypothetical protein
MKYLAYLLILVSVTVYNCDTSFDCDEVDTLTVFDDLRNVDSIVYMSSRILFPSDILDTTYQGMTFFINSNADYDALKQKAINAACGNCEFPNIDFTNRTLIGHFYKIGCLDIAQQRFVTTSDSTFAFYSKFINTNQCSFATCNNETFNWMLVPKVDDISQVEFYNGNLYYNCDC